jgi:hypothetical protein
MIVRCNAALTIKSELEYVDRILTTSPLKITGRTKTVIKRIAMSPTVDTNIESNDQMQGIFNKQAE